MIQGALHVPEALQYPLPPQLVSNAAQYALLGREGCSSVSPQGGGGGVNTQWAPMQLS